MSHAVNFHGQIFIGDLEVFLVSDCFEDETLSYLFSSSSFVVSTELCFCLVHSLEVVIKRHVLAFEVSVCDSLVYQCVVVSFFSLLESLQLHLLLQACLQLVDGFELADGFSEFVIDFRQLFALYIIDMNFKFSFLALQSIYEVVCRECNLDIYIVACLVAFELVFKTWNEALGTDFQRIGLAFAAFEWFAVNKALEVDDSIVALLQDSPVFSLFKSCALFSTALQLFHDFIVRDFRLSVFCFQPLVFAEFYFRTFNESSSEYSAFGFREFVFLYIRSCDRNQFFLLQSFVQCVIDDDVLSFCFDSFLAEMHFKNLAACLALAEARDLYLVGDACYSGLETFLYCFCRYFHIQRYFVLVQCLYLNVHKNYSSLSRLSDKLIPTTVGCPTIRYLLHAFSSILNCKIYFNIAKKKTQIFITIF